MTCPRCGEPWSAWDTTPHEQGCYTCRAEDYAERVSVERIVMRIEDGTEKGWHWEDRPPYDAR